MESKRVDLTPEARAELFEAADFYEDRQLGLGDDFLDCVWERLEQISAAPESERFAPGLEEAGVRLTQIRRFPYRVVFVELPDEVRVLAIAHARRWPRYWKDRLPG